MNWNVRYILGNFFNVGFFNQHLGEVDGILPRQVADCKADILQTGHVKQNVLGINLSIAEWKIWSCRIPAFVSEGDNLEIFLQNLTWLEIGRAVGHSMRFESGGNQESLWPVMYFSAADRAKYVKAKNY